MSAQLSATLWSTIVGSGTLVRHLIQLLKFPFSVPPKKFLTQRVVSRHVCRSSVKLSPTLSTVSPGRNGSWSTRFSERSVFEEFVGRTQRVLVEVAFDLPR